MIVTMPEIIIESSNTVKVGIIPEECRLDVIKSIVYGGLLEFITSLSVVVCAAGGDASTCEFSASFSCIIFVVVHTFTVTNFEFREMIFHIEKVGLFG